MHDSRFIYVIKRCKEAGIRKDILKKYLEYLEAAFLIKVVNRIDQTAKRLQRVTSFKIYLTNPSLRCALFSPVNGDDDFIGSMVETAIFSQWIQGGKTDFYYANWTKGRDKGEVDIVWIDDATQKPYSLTEIKWSDRFAENPSELKSLYRFCENNRGNLKVVVTTKTKTSVWKDDDYNIFFIPSSIYAYWVSDYLYKNRKAELLQIAPFAK